MSKQPRPLPRPLSFPLGDGESFPVRSLLHDPALEALYLPQGYESTIGTYAGSNTTFTKSANFAVADSSKADAVDLNFCIEADTGCDTGDWVRFDMGAGFAGLDIRGIYMEAFQGSQTSFPYKIQYSVDGSTGWTDISGTSGTMTNIDNIADIKWVLDAQYRYYRLYVTGLAFAPTNFLIDYLFFYIRTGRSDTLVDFSGNGNDGTLVGSTWRAYELIFDGDDTIDCGDVLDLGTSTNPDLTFFIYTRFRLGQEDESRIVMKGADNTSGYSLVTNTGPNLFRFRTEQSGANTPILSASNVWDSDVLVSVCITKSGTTGAIYIDGEYSTDGGSTTLTHAISASGVDFSIGSSPVPDNYSTMDFKFLAVYSRALDSSEITVLDAFARGL